MVNTCFLFARSRNEYDYESGDALLFSDPEFPHQGFLFTALSLLLRTYFSNVVS
jgi:hypothetical protein